MRIYKIPLYIIDIITGKRKLNISLEKVDNEKKNFAMYLLNNNFNIDEKSINKKIYEKLIAVEGIGASAGSSAITDFLGEFSCCTALGGVDELENPERGMNNSFEFDFFRDSHGVYELEKICDFDGNRILEGSIQDFIDLIEKNNSLGIDFYGDYYLKATQEFLHNILDCYYEWEGVCNNFFVKKITKDEYRKYAKEYCQTLLKSIPSEKYLCMDQLCSISNPHNKVLSEYFGDYKLLTSIRDPRDIYTTARMYPTRDLGYNPKDAKTFVKYYKWNVERYNYKSNPNVMLIQFEDFVLHYEDVSKKIMDFVGLDEKEHIKKFSYFNPEISRNNIGIYKKYDDQASIKIIEDGLSEYLYK